jgi:hypothetical protein
MADTNTPGMPADSNPGDRVPPGTAGAGDNICPVCAGRGMTNGQACENCGGSGKVIEPVGGA